MRERIDLLGEILRSSSMFRGSTTFKKRINFVLGLFGGCVCCGNANNQPETNKMPYYLVAA